MLFVDKSKTVGDFEDWSSRPLPQLPPQTKITEASNMLVMRDAVLFYWPGIENVFGTFSSDEDMSHLEEGIHILTSHDILASSLLGEN